VVWGHPRIAPDPTAQRTDTRVVIFAGEDAADTCRTWPRRHKISLVVLFGLAAAVRLWALWAIGDVPKLHGDEGYYISAARALARGDGYPGSMRPPGFPFFAAGVFRATTGSLHALRIAQIALSLVGLWFFLDLLRRRFGARPALISSAIVAFHPTLIHYTHFLWAENLVTTLLLAALWALDRWDATARRPWVVVTGLALGALILTREMALYFVPVVVAWMLRRGPRRSTGDRIKDVVLLTVIVAAMVLPWTARNYALHHRVVLVGTLQWFAIAEGNLLPDSNWIFAPGPLRPFHVAYFAISDELRREAFARDVALRAIGRDQPAWIFKKVIRNVYQLFTPSRTQLTRFARAGWLAPGSDALAGRLALIEAVFYVASLSVGVAALCLVPDARLKSLVVALLLVFLSIYIVSAANHRYRAPLLPLFALYIGPLVCGHSARDRTRGARRVAAAVSVALVAALCLAGFTLDPG
jgi:4-amino-4-deoxy-L-arabinose transferase-like glycosyltransferase